MQCIYGPVNADRALRCIENVGDSGWFEYMLAACSGFTQPCCAKNLTYPGTVDLFATTLTTYLTYEVFLPTPPCLSLTRASAGWPVSLRRHVKRRTEISAACRICPWLRVWWTVSFLWIFVKSLSNADCNLDLEPLQPLSVFQSFAISQRSCAMMSLAVRFPQLCTLGASR